MRWARRRDGWLRAVAFLAWPVSAFAADPQIASLIDDPDPVPAGGTYVYSLRVDNNAVDAAINTRLRFTVAAGATFVSATPSSQNCSLTTPTEVNCNLGTLAAGGADVRNIALTWRATGPGPATVDAIALLSADNDDNAGNNRQDGRTTVISGGNLGLGKGSTPNPVVGGANVTYTLTVSNDGPNVSDAITLTDILPPSVSFVSATGGGWTCGHAAGTVTCNRAGPHAVGAAIPIITIIGTVNAAGGTITNSASIAPAAGGTADPDNTNNTATADTTVLPGADVRIAQKTVTTPVPAVAGSNVTFRIDPRNGGPAAATNAVVTDTLPVGWTFVSAVGPNWTCSAVGRAVTCSRATFPMGATDNITLVATAPDNAAVGGGMTFANTASIASDTTDPTPGNNSGMVAVNVLPDGADLRLAKSKSPNPVAQGAELTSTIVVTNNGPRAATGPLRVVEALTGETFVSDSDPWTCTPAGTEVVCDHPNAGGLAVGASRTLTITTTADSPGAVANTACTGSSVPPGSMATPSPPAEGDANAANDCATASANSTTVQPDLAIAKTTSTPTGVDKVVSTSEAAVTYTLVVTNASTTPQDATGVRISDTVPAFISGRTTIDLPVATVSAGTATFSCAVVNAVVTCTQDGGVLAQGQTVTVPITVRRAMREGNFTNTATVTNTAEGDPNSGNNSASDTVTIEPIADVEMTGKTVTPATVRAGQNATYVLSYRNNGPSTASDVVVADTLTLPGGDSGLTVISIASTKGGSTCSIAAGAQLTPAASAFNCTIGTLANGETQTVTLVVRPNFQVGNAARVFDNTATITTSSVENPAGGDNGNNSQSTTLNVSAAAIDLLVNQTDITDPVPYTAGSTFLNYRVRVTSNGPSFGTNVRFTETMTPPAGRRVRFVCDTTAAGSATCNAAPLCSVADVTSDVGVALAAFTCQVPAGTAVTGPAVGELASGRSKDVFLRFEVLDQPAPTGDVFNSSARVSANEPDTAPANDTEAEGTTTRQRIDLRLTKSASASPVALRQPFNWTIAVTNNGPGNSLQTDVTDTLPVGTEVVGAVPGAITWTRTLQPANGTCTLSGRVVSCALGQLDATGTATITVPVRFTSFPAGGSASNSASVDVSPAKTGGIDTPGGNNTGSAAVTVTRSAITGTVFEDRDRAGSNGGTPQAAGTEPRVSAVTLQLTGTDQFGNAVDVTTTTDGSGNYRFDNLSPSNAGGYTITQTQPAGFVNGPVATPSAGVGAPSDGGNYDAGGAAGNSTYTAVVIGANVTATDYNFPEVRRPSLSGFVYVDVNGNGSRDAGTDTPINGATVRLLNAGTLAEVATTTTNASGAYSFADLDPLTTYVLEEPLPTTPANLANGTATAGLIGGAACASGCTVQADTPANDVDRIAAIDLGSGADGTLFNFGELQRTAISGTVYVDRDRDSAIDPTPADGRLGGVTLMLYAGGTCSGVPLQTLTTDADGNYMFDNLIPGRTYTVCQTQPGGYGDGGVNAGTNGSSSTANAITVSNLPATGSAGNHFAERVSSLAGSVYLDADNDGVRDGGEAGIATVTVTLTGTDINGNAVSRSTDTDGTGAYRFDDLLAANAAGYTVTEQVAQPVVAGTTTLNGRTRAGSEGGTATAVTATPSNVSAIALGAGVAATDYDFGEILPVSVSGRVFNDFDNSGTANLAGETGIGSVTITITGTDDTGAAVSRSVDTGVDGTYAVTGLRPGTYTITEPTQPPATGNGLTVAGSAGGTVTAVSTVPSAISSIDLMTPGTNSTNNNFAEVPLTSISGSVYVDRDRDGAIDPTPADARIGGVTLSLYAGSSCSGVPLQTTTTDADGNYAFANVAAGGTYTICQTQPGGYGDGGVNAGTNGSSSTTNAITINNLPIGGSTGNHFAERLGSLAGSVYLDADNDGVRDGGEAGIGTVTVTLTGTDINGNVVSRSTVTDGTGAYRFDDLLAANAAGYTVTEQVAQPVVAGTTTLNGTTRAGSVGGTATAVAATPSNVSAIALGGGVDATGYDFGEILPVAVSGRVFIDLDNSGTANLPGETGIGSVTITITGIDDTGAAVSRSVETGVDGTYAVTDLRPGTYTVTEPTQPPATSNGLTVAGSAGGSVTAVTTLASAISNVDLRTPGANSINNNFAEIANSSAINGRVWLDADNDGVLDAGESGIAGVTVQLTGSDTAGQPVSRTTTTDATGRYAFEMLPPGTYRVTEPEQPPGTLSGRSRIGSTGGTATPASTTPSVLDAIPLAVGQTSADNDFGEVPSGRIGGQVWSDNDNDGVIDAGETLLAGVTVQLTGTDDLGNAVSLTLVTDASGGYTFDGLRPGTYTLTEPTQPAGTVNGQTVPGSSGGTATLPSATPSAIAGIVLPPGGSSLGNNFGEIGNSPDLRVRKTHTTATFTVGHTTSYTIGVRNIGELPTSGNYRVDDALPTGLTLAANATGNGWTCDGAVGGVRFSCSSSAIVAAGAESTDAITVSVRVGAAAAAASPVSNTVLVEGDDEIAARRPSIGERTQFTNDPPSLPVCTTPATHNVCRDPAPVQLAASLSGTVWFDIGAASRRIDGGDRRLPGWRVEVVDVASGAIVATATTGSDGTYNVADLIPGVAYNVRFRDPDAGVVYGYPVNGETAPESSGAACAAALPPPGTASSCVGSGANPLLTVVLAAGQNLPQQSLPVDPSGVVYDSGTRVPVPGSVVTLTPTGGCAGWDPRTGIVGATSGGYTISGSGIAMTVGRDGFYQFLIAPSAPASCTFAITVTPPAEYRFVSNVIPPQSTPLTPPGGPGSVFPVQPQAGAPTAPVGTGTTYHLSVVTGSGGANIVHNHIPLDPALPASLTLAKTGDRAVAEVGDSVRYTITVVSPGGILPRQTTVVDRLPAGFTYIAGTATVNDQPIADPMGGVGPTLAFNLGPMPPAGQHVLRYRLRVGVGAAQGDGVNRAEAIACGIPTGCVDGSFSPLPGSRISNDARFRVRVGGGVFANEACVLGKVFVDCNHNHVQDDEEIGIPGVRFVLSEGTTLVSDSEGKYSVCGLEPRSHVMRIDVLTLPRGSRLVTSSNRNLGDSGSLWLDLKNGELHRADFIEGSCSNTVLEQVKARRAQGEVSGPQPEAAGVPALRFDSKAHGLTPLSSPARGTDGANQQVPKVRTPAPGTNPPRVRTDDERSLPTPALPMNRPPPVGRGSGTAPGATDATTNGGTHAPL